MLVRLVYLIATGIFAWLFLMTRSSAARNAEVALPGPGWPDRALLAALTRLLPRALREHRSVPPRTLPARHQRLMKQKWTQPPSTGRPTLPEEIRDLIIQLGTENPRWGFRHMHAPSGRPCL
ncbi:integrase [Streptomyces sp. LZ34]